MSSTLQRITRMAGGEAEMIARAHAKDREAERMLVDHLMPVIRCSVQRRLAPVARARGRDPNTQRDDLVAEVWMYLFEHDWRVLRDFDPARGALAAYISTIADRRVFAVFRVKSRDPFGETPMTDEELEMQSPTERGHEQQIWARSELDALYRFLCNRLDDRGLLLFHMLEVDALSIAEVSQRTGMSADALYQWRARFRRLARDWRDNRR